MLFIIQQRTRYVMLEAVLVSTLVKGVYAFVILTFCHAC